MSMNRVFPSINELEQLNPKLTPGEWFLVDMLNQKLDKEWKIYVQPYLPNLRPDIVIVHPQKGLVVWEVKDWNLEIFSFYDGRLYGQANGNSWVQENPIYKTKLYIDTITEYILTPNYESANIGQLLSFTKCRGAVYFLTSDTAKTLNLYKE